MRGTGCKPPYGYPVVIAAYGYDDHFSLNEAKMKDDRGEAVDCILRNPSNDPEARNWAILIPKRPLAPKSVYTVSASFSVGGEATTKTWSFETGSAEPVPVKSKKKKG
jgi:hypothetical protein